LSDSNLSKFSIMNFPLGNFSEIKNHYQIDINCNIFSMFIYNKRKISWINLDNHEIHYKYLKRNFSRGVIISQDYAIIRGMDSQKNQIFYKIGLMDSSSIEENNVSPRLHDAGMDSDGQLSFDPSTGLLVFVFYYGKGFLCMDTSLNTIYKGDCID